MSMMRRFATVAFIVAAVSTSQSSFAQTTTNAENPCGCVWRDAKTGEPVASGPILQAGITLTNQPVDRAVRTDPADRNTAFDPESGRNFVLVPCPPQTATTTPPTSVARGPGTTGMGFTPTIQLRGFGGATIVNGNAPSTAGFDGAVLFPLGNRVLVGPTAGFQWVNSSIVSSIGSMTVGSTFANTSVGFKSGNFGGRLGLTLGGWELGVNGGATVAGSTITQNEGFCDPTAGCTISSTTTTHDTVVGPFVGGYISHSIFSHAGVFVEFDYHRLKDNGVFDVSDRAVVGGIVLSFGRHK
jgi:hypothetical protein